MHSATERKRRDISVQDELPLKILVQSEMVGAIIGKSGGTIKQITQSTKARIDVHRDESSDRNEKVISISGPIENCSDACFKIVEIIQNEKIQLSTQQNANNNDTNDLNNSHSTNRFAGRQGVVDPYPYSDDEQQLKILAPNNLIGRLIGRGGSSIKKIMEQTSTKINISTKSPATIKNEHTITITGNFDSIRRAESVISAKLRAAHSNDIASTIQAISTQPYLLNNNIARNPYLSNAYTNPAMPPLINPPMVPENHMSRPLGSNTAGSSQIFSNNSHGYLPMYPNYGPPHQSPLFCYNPLTNGQEYEKETVDMFIPNAMVGAIIGVSGSTIKEMISYSGANIKIAPVTSNSDAQNGPNNVKSNADVRDNNPAPNDNSNHNDKTEKDGGTMPKNEHKLDSQTRHHYSKDPELIRRVTVVGYPEAQYMAQYLIYRKVSIETGRSDTSLMVEIRIPSHLVGRLIGKAGASIKKMQKQTHTTIRLPEEQSTDPEQNSETAVLITGEFQGSQLAQRQLRSLVKGGSSSSLTNRNKSHPAQESGDATKTPVRTNHSDKNDQKNDSISVDTKLENLDISDVCAKDEHNEVEGGTRVAQEEHQLVENSQTLASSNHESQVSNNNNLESDLNHDPSVHKTIKVKERSIKENHEVTLNGTIEPVKKSFDANTTEKNSLTESTAIRSGET